MTHQIFDIIELIRERVLEYLEATGARPRTLAIPPAVYRRLIELRAREEAIGTLRVEIDEALSDTEITLT